MAKNKRHLKPFAIAVRREARVNGAKVAKLNHRESSNRSSVRWVG